MSIIDFSQKHCRRFGYEREADHSMILEWASIQINAGVELPDLEEASKQLLKSTQTTFTREQHLQRLNTILGVVTDRKRTYAAKACSHGPRCPICRDARGVVSVPLLRQVDCGIWTGRQTQAVVCNCPDGFRWSNTRNAKDQAMMTLGEYERKNPLWRSQLRDRDEQANAKNLNLERARELDGKGVSKLDQSLANILARLQPKS